MKRREFITRLGGAVAAAPVLWPLAVCAEPALPVIGFLHSGTAEENAARVAGFRKGLRTAGFIEGVNVAIEFRWASGDFTRLPQMAADLIERRVAVITTPASAPAAVVAKAATKDIPIVFAVGADPVAMGLVASLNRPGGNVTGIATLNAELAAKRLGLLREMAPLATHFTALVNPTNAALTQILLRELQTAATTFGIQVETVQASTDSELQSAFATISQKPGTAVLLGTDSFFYSRRAFIAELAARHGLPAAYDNRDFTIAGGLMSYGPDVVNTFELTGRYIGRVLKGEKPSDLPIEQSTKFETIINLKAAKALRLEPPAKLLFTADEVIE